MTMWVLLLGCGVIRGNLPGRDQGKASDPGAMVRKDIDESAHADAVCNDGTRPVFYHRPGTGGGVDKWLVFLKGGGACGDEATCTGRGVALTSSKTWMSRDTLGSDDDDVGGILSPAAATNPDFHDWNHVYVPYCSSDFWTGDRQASKATFDMHFRGSRIVDAVVDRLRDKAVVGPRTLDQATEVILAGSSAGAIGVVQNVDRLAASLPGARVGGIADAGFNAADELDYSMLYDLWQPRLDASCLRSGTKPADCLEGFVMLEQGAMGAPTFVQQSQLDPNLVRGFDASDPADERAAETMWADLRRVMAEQDGAFCPAESVHMTLTNPSFTSLTIGGVTLAEAVGTWWFDRKGPKRHIVPDCELSGPSKLGKGSKRR